MSSWVIANPSSVTGAGTLVVEKLESCRPCGHLGLDLGYFLGLLLVEGLRYEFDELCEMVERCKEVGEITLRSCTSSCAESSHTHQYLNLSENQRSSHSEVSFFTLDLRLKYLVPLHNNARSKPTIAHILEGVYRSCGEDAGEILR